MSKGLNRGLGTLIAGGLALAVAELAAQMGRYGMVTLIISTFIVGKLEIAKFIQYLYYDIIRTYLIQNNVLAFIFLIARILCHLNKAAPEDETI